MTSTQTPLGGPALRAHVQRAGRFLSAMIMPNIGAFIAWGLITALFIPTGWLPHAAFARLVGPMITWLLPLLIGYTGGQLVHGGRGGVIGAIVTAGVVVGADVPMLMGAMLVGPLAAWALRTVDQRLAGRIRPGFEMLVNNFSLGILGGALVLVACAGVGPLLGFVSRALATGVNTIVAAKLLPLVHLLIEPGKVLFLNNAINHGILGPLALTQSAESGRSLLFLLETNPGPGLGILLAYWLRGSGVARAAAPAATVIHFLGGIHEIYFPYVLMRPRLIVAAIAGGMAATTLYAAFGAGLVAMPSPGSVFAYAAMAPRGGLVLVLSGVVVAAAVSFVVASVMLKLGRNADNAADDLAAACARMESLKQGTPAAAPVTVPAPNLPRAVRKIVFACDAGMGSSAMGAAVLRQTLQRAGVNVAVGHAAVNEIPADADLVITHRALTARARQYRPAAEHVSVDDFLQNPVYNELATRLRGSAAPATPRDELERGPLASPP
jgi:mannitol PTS system EIICBA or EIICB component